MMVSNQLTASVAIGVICGCAFAGGLLANGTAPVKALVVGLLVIVATSMFVACLARALARP
jgi:hypothetical protein